MDRAVFPHGSLAWDQTMVGLWWPPPKGFMPPCHNSQDRYSQCPWPRSRPLSTNTSTGDSWILTSKSGSVSCEVTTPFTWVLGHTRLFGAFQESLSPVHLDLVKVSFHSNPKEKQCHKIFKLPHNCTHFTCSQGNAQNAPSKASILPELRNSRCTSWI